MALDKEYFEAIELEVVKKKYYSAKKVKAVLADIRRQAIELSEDNERMRTALSTLAERRVELGDAMLSAQGVYRGIVEKANARADEIVAEAERRAAEIAAESRRQQEDAVQRVQRLFETMRTQYESAIETINTEWQDYLCGLYPEKEPEAEPERVPEDLKEKVGAIAQELFEINAESDEDDEDED